jgi:choline oxidase
MVLDPRDAATVTLRSAEPADAPAIHPRYLADPAEQRVAAEGLRTARELTRHGPLAALLGAELDPGPSVTGTGLVDYVAATVEPANHLSGTCRMGRPGESVVDERLRVRGVGGLRVADASVFAGNLGVNPNLTCLMIGERCADYLAADAGAVA